MSDQPVQEQKSYLVVQFASVGSVLFTFKSEGVTAMQLLALAAYMDLKAKDTIMQEEVARAEEKEQAIAKPVPKLIVPGR